MCNIYKCLVYVFGITSKKIVSTVMLSILPKLSASCTSSATACCLLLFVVANAHVITSTASI